MALQRQNVGLQSLKFVSKRSDGARFPRSPHERRGSCELPGSVFAGNERELCGINE